MWKFGNLRTISRLPNFQISKLSKAPMSFLDRFKIQPKHKSADPDDPRRGRRRARRAAEEDAAVLLALAREDADARVRRAAVGADRGRRGAGGDRRRSDPDPAIREEVLDAARRHRRRRRPRRAASRRSAALTDPKQIATVAKTSPVDSVRAAAVGRLTDVKSLSSVARHATDPRTAALAARSHRGSGRAPERRGEDRSQGRRHQRARARRDPGADAIAPRSTALADRAKNKSVGQARPRDGPGDGRRRSGEEGGARSAPAADRRRDRARRSARRVDDDGGRRRAAARGRSRVGAASSRRATHEITAADRGRFDAAVVGRARDRSSARRRNAPSRSAATRNWRPRAARKATMCERVEAIHGDDALDRMAQARSEWEGLRGGSGSGDARRLHGALRRGVPPRGTPATRTCRRARRPTCGSRSWRARRSSSPRRKTAPPTRGTRCRASGTTLRGKSEIARRGGPAALHRGRDDRSASAPRRRRPRPRRRCASRCSASTS